MAYLRILTVNDKVASSSFKGTIKKEHVRAFEVLSRGDKRSYYLSTDRNDLGVVLATSAAGATMVPVSWECMQCPETKALEYRKVAKLLSDEEVAELKKQYTC